MSTQAQELRLQVDTDYDHIYHLVTQALIGTDKSALLNNSNAVFGAESVHIGAVHVNVVSVFGTYKKSYFTKYKAALKFTLTITKSLKKGLEESFSGKELSFRASQDTLFLNSKDGKTDYDETLVRPEETASPEKFPIQMELTEFGYLPKSRGNLPIKLFVNSSDLRFPKSAEQVTFEYKDGKLRYKIEGIGRLKSIIEVADAKLETLNATASIEVSTKYLNPILSVIRGNVWMVPHPEALIFCETDEKHMVTWIQATRKQ